MSTVCTSRTFLFMDQSSPNFSCPTWKGLPLMKFFFRCSICRSVPEIFGIKVESCQKSRRNLDVFWPSQILGGRPSKNCTQIITPASRHVVWRTFVKIFPTALKLLRRIRWILGPIFNFHDKIFLGDSSQLGCALSSLGQSLACIKIWGGSSPQHPLLAEI